MYELKICSSKDIVSFMEEINVTATGVALMSGKARVRVIKVNDLDLRAANLLKQEALAIGADFAVPKEMCTLTKKRTCGILIANEKQLSFLLNRLKLEPFGLKEFAESIADLLKNSEGDFALKCKNTKLTFKEPAIMGIINTTPDSFSDGGRFDKGLKNAAVVDIDAVLDFARQMIKDGAKILDIGGESTGPGSKNVSIEDELERVIPAVKAVRKIFKGVISVDTYKAEVAEMAIKAGADMINDVTAGRGDKEMFRTVAKYGAGYCMMYSKDKTARTTRENVQYDDVVRTIFEFLERRIDLAVKAGVKLESICVDPGMGAFVSADSKYSLQLIKNIGAFRALGVPVLVGASRKSFISGVIKDKGPQDRMEGSLIASVMAGLNGADILRVHDAGETVRGIRMGRAINVI